MPRLCADDFDHAHIEMHMLVQAGAEAVDEGNCAHSQRRLVRMRCAVGLQRLRNDAQEDRQCQA